MTQKQHKTDMGKAGFSLVEIIMVLVLIGVIGAMGSIGISTFFRSYLFVQENQDRIGAAQIALLRIAKELSSLRVLNTAVSNNQIIRFKAEHNDGNYTLEILQVGTDVKLREYADNGTLRSDDLLVSDIESSGLGFKYYVWDSDTAVPIQEDASPTWTGDQCAMTIDKAYYDSGAGEIAFEIVPPDVADSARIFYDNTLYTTTLVGGKYTQTLTSVVDPLCQYAFVYSPDRTNQTMCFFKIKVLGDAYTEKTAASCYELPAMSSITGRTVTRLIGASLKYDGIEELSIQVRPRNIAE